MKLRLLLFLAVTASLQSFGQQWVEDSVYMGAGYANDVYYSMKNDSVKGESNSDWHIAFDMLPYNAGGSAGVIANHVGGNVTVYSLPFKASAKFASLSAADTMTKAGPWLNADSAWLMGAFNANLGGSPFDYGWGKYDQNTHYVEGDSLYLVYIGSDPYKMTVKHYHSFPYDSIYYEFHIAKFDGSNDHTVKIYRKSDNFEDNNFGYYNVTSNQVLDREPAKNAWDIVFTRYKEWILAGPPPKVPYSVTGLLSNIGIEVADVQNIDPNNAVYTNYTFTDKANEIGSDWKRFDMTAMSYVVKQDTSYFVKTENTMEYYQLKFTAFESSTGKIVFAKRKVADIPVGVKNVEQNVIAHALVPNPANYNADLMLDINDATGSAMLIVTDMTGRIAQRADINLKKGLNAFRINTSAFAAGTYMVTVSNGSWKTTDKLVVQH